MTILVTFLGMFTNALLTVVVLVCVCFALVVTRFWLAAAAATSSASRAPWTLNGYIESDQRSESGQGLLP